MKKNEFLKELRQVLNNKNIRDIDGILADYEEHFFNAEQKGIAEEQAVKSLGSVKAIADAYQAEEIVQQIEENKSFGNWKKFFKVIFVLLLLSPLNFFLFLFTILSAFLMWLLLGRLAYFSAGAAFKTVTALLLTDAFSNLSLVGTVSLAITFIMMSVFFVSFLVWISLKIYQVILQVIKWNIKVTQGGSRG